MRKRTNRIVVMPSDAIDAYIEVGKTYEYLADRFNPLGYFKEVYCLSPFIKENADIAGVKYRKVKELDLKKEIRKINPDVVRAYDGFRSSDWACASRVKRIPIVVSVHDTNPDLIYDSIKYADMVICMAKAVKQAVIDKVEVDDNRIFILPNRVNLSMFCHKDEEEKNRQLTERYGTGKHIIHVGRKAEQKNLDTLIKAFAYLPEEFKGIFIGRGDSKGYEDLAEKCGVRERCFFVTSVSNEELPYYYSWCDCMCTPSRWEGFGIVFIEAAACESMVITSNIAPMNEYLTHNENAILVDEYEKAEKIAEAIKRACADSEDILRMKKNARRVGELFAKEEVDRMEVDLYKKVIDDSVRKDFPHMLRFRLRKKIVIEQYHKVRTKYALKYRKLFHKEEK